MNSVIKNVIDGNVDEDTHSYFVRFGKGKYERRFLLNLSKGSKLKVRGSFEWANDLVRFVNESGDVKFSGKILTRERIEKNGKSSRRETFGEPRKKGASFVYEVSEASLEDFENAYFYLLNANSGDMVLKIKKSLPKPGKDKNKIDDKFCSLDLDVKHWPKLKEFLFWDVPDNVKKVKIEHTLDIKEIVIPSGEDNPVKIRELAKRKGLITRVLDIDKNVQKKDYDFIA